MLGVSRISRPTSQGDYHFFTVVSLKKPLVSLDQLSSFVRAENACDESHEIIAELLYRSDSKLLTIDTWGPDPGQTFRMDLTTEPGVAAARRAILLFREAYKAAIAAANGELSA